MKFGFVTCVQLGKSCMEAIYEVGGQLDLVITLEDTQAVEKSGRAYLDRFCDLHKIKLHKSSHINNQDCIEAIKQLNIDWLFIIGWSQIAKNAVLNAPNKGVLGIHPTLLPQGRGRAAIPWAILKGLEKTGVTMFKLDEGVDTGDIVEQLEILLTKNSNATELYSLVNNAHAELIRSTFTGLKSDKIKLKTQDNSLATEWPGRKPEDGQIDLEGSVYDAEKLVRAVTRPYPGAYYYLNSKKIIVWSSKVTNNKNRDNSIIFTDGVLELLDFQVIG